MSKLSQGMTNGDSSFKLHDRRCLCTFLFQRNEAGKGCVIPPAALKLIVPQSHLRNTPGPAGSFSVLSLSGAKDPCLLSNDLPPVFPGQKGYYPSRYPRRRAVIAQRYYCITVPLGNTGVPQKLDRA